jgi:hypothetical protein
MSVKCFSKFLGQKIGLLIFLFSVIRGTLGFLTILCLTIQMACFGLGSSNRT